MNFRLDNLWKGDGLTYNSVLVPPIPDPNPPVLSLDAATYIGSGNWIDSIGNKNFVLNGNTPPAYTSTGEKYFEFIAASNQYAECSTSLPTMNTFTLEVWHYWDGNNTGGQPCILTEIYPQSGSINYGLGTLSNGITQGGWYNGGWQVSPNMSLTPNTWYQIVVTVNSSKVIKVYLNNSLISTTQGSGIAPATSNSGIRLMRRWDAMNCWGGRLGLVNIYNTALDSTAISTKWNANKSRFGL